MDDNIRLFEELIKFIEETDNYSYYDFAAYLLKTDERLHSLLKNHNLRLAVSEYLKSKKRKAKTRYNEPRADAMLNYYEVLASHEEEKSGDKNE